MKLPLSDWAARHYDPPPSLWVLRRWCRDGEIYPTPERVGKSYYVDETAQRLTSGFTLMQRLKAA